MKMTKRILAFLLSFTLLLSVLPASVFAAGEDALTIGNGYIEVRVSKKNGGFLVNTAEGNLLNKSDNNKDLLYHSGSYDTSFVSLRVGSGKNAKDYLFGGKYDGASTVSVTQAAENGEIVAVWSVDGITFTQTVSLAADNASEHGMVSVALAAENNSGAAVPVKARILLDTCLGDQDWAHYQVSGGNLTNTLDTEQLLTDETEIRSFYAVDDVISPSITAYAVSEPYQAAIGHWNNLASSLFDFAPDTSMNFTNPINDYLTADSACALYYDLGTLAKGASGSAVSYYGVYSNHSVNLDNSVAINTTAPLRLELNEAKTAYVRQSEVGIADFSVIASVENYAGENAKDLENVILAVRSGSSLRSLSDSGQPMNGFAYNTADPLTISYTELEVGDTITKTLYFQAKPLESASYERITIGMYKDQVTQENLLGEKIVYILLPGSDGNIPKVSFQSMTPTTIYSSGTRHLYVAVSNENILTNALQSGVCELKAYSADGKTVRGIPAENLTVTDGIADVALTEDIALAVGSWYLQLEWNDQAVSDGIVTADQQKQTAACLRFNVSDDPKYRNDCYGVLAAVKYGKGTTDDPYTYRLESFKDEAAFTAFSKDKSKYTEILLVFRGEFTADKRYLKKNEDGKTVGAFYYTAVSKKTMDPTTRTTTVTNCITINNCLDFEGGTMSIYYEDYGRGQTWAEQSPILVEFDGDLLTSDARTPVWKGKAAITKLEQGEDYGLLRYDANGKRKQMKSDPITLIWPNVYGLAQTLAGMAFKLAYGQFGVMEKDGRELGRTIAFTASLSLKFMTSDDDDDSDEGTASYFGRMKELWSDWRGASIYQYAYHGSRFEKLTSINMNDKDTSDAKDKGVQASVMVQDILFGCGQGFVGLNFTVEIGVKNMIDSLPKLTGKLSINTINNWSFGLAGSCKMSNKLNLEAKLSFKSYHNIPVPDEIYFFIGGFNPGINIDGCGVVWITGGGGGISNLYDTIFCKSGLPPLKLIIAASFSIIQVLDGNAKLTMSLTGLDLTASDLKIFGEIEAIRKVQLGLQWYPDLKIQAGIYVSMFEQVIEGQGYIILLAKNYTDWFFEMFVSAALKVPASVPLVGGMTLIGVDLGVSTKKIWGSFEALKIGVSVTYYWGESGVSFGTAGDKAQPTYPDLLLGGRKGDIPTYYDAENDRILYARFGENFEAPKTAQVLSGSSAARANTAGVWSTVDKTSHKFNLGAYNPANNAATAVQLSYAASGLAEAKALAQTFTVTDAGNHSFPLSFYDGSNADTANANVTWDEATGTAVFGFTVTETNQFGKDWRISTGTTAADIVLYNVLPLPELTSVSLPGAVTAGTETAVQWDGTGLDELDSIRFFLCDSTDPADGAGYPLTADAFPDGITSSSDIQSKRLTLTVPAEIPDGSYYLRAVYTKEDQLCSVIHSTAAYTVTNPKTPAAIGAVTVKTGGDLKYDVTVPASGDANTTGYLATVLNTDGTETEVSGLTYDKAKSGATVFSIGGAYEAPVKAEDDDPDSAASGTKTCGLEGGKRYIVEVTPYKTFDTNDDGEDDAIVYGETYRSAAILLPRAVTPTASLSANGKALTAVQELADDSELPTFTESTLTVDAAFSEAVSGTWTLDSGSLWTKADDDTAVVSGSFGSGSHAAILLPDLADGDHVLTLTGQAADGDRFSASFPFTVDTTAPRLLLSSPLNGSPFNADGTVTVAGVTDADAALRVRIDGGAEKTLSVTPDPDGVFSEYAAIPDPDGASVHTLQIYAVDPNGNRTETREITVVHPGLGDLAGLVLTVDGVVPTDGCIHTEQAAEKLPLTVLGVTSAGTRFVLDSSRVSWRSFAAEGGITADGTLSYTAYTKGFVEAMVEVSAGAYRTASLALYAQAPSHIVTVSATDGGLVAGGGLYDVGTTVTLSASPVGENRFDHWELTGVTGVTLSDPTLSFVMPDNPVSVKACFVSTHVHDYELTGWSWTGYTAATASFTCKGDASHVETVEATITSARTEPTCETDGSIVYTAAVTFAEQTYTDVKTETLAASGHNYELTGWNWTGYTEAAATFTCKNDASHVQSVNATISSVRTEPTAEANGSVVYTATVSFEGRTYTDVQTEILPALGHDYELVGWNWTGYTAATATFRDKNGGANLTVDALISSVRTEPTCETAGQAVYTATVTLSGRTYTDTRTEILIALGHDWGTPAYEWAEDNSSVTAIRTCKNDASHVETERVNTTSEVTTAATCLGAGKTTYTASFTNPAFQTQTKTVTNIAPLGHDYELTGWSWTGFAAATATFTCKNDASHVQTVTATINSVRTEPTCETAGSVVYTATVTFAGQKYTDAKTEILSALGHDYALTGWSWTGFTAATATFTCKNDAAHVQTVNATITSERTEPTAQANGSVVYTATVLFGGRTYTDAKTEILPALGHDYELSGWNWTGYTAATATFRDKNGGADLTVNATISSERTEPTCETAGQVVYTATVTLSGQTYTDTRTETLIALGHDWGTPAYEWAEDNSSVTATRTCKNDADHVETERVNTASEVTTAATCLGAGKTTYTASFTNPAFETQTKTVADVAPLGHDYELTGWSWTGFAAATATFTCKNDATHVQTVEATITSERTEPTAEENGSVVYTATVTFAGQKYTDARTEILPALGHDYELSGWSWTGYTAAAATFRDKNGGADLTVNAQISSERTEPTCETAGQVVYTATVTLDGQTYTDTKTETLPATGHDWGEPTYEWAEDYSEITATRICRNDASHVETEKGVISSEVTLEATVDAEGEITYTATFTDPAFETQTATVATPKLDPGDGLPCDGGENCPGNVFTDMPPKGNWAHDAIDWAVVYKITAGTSATTFSPSAGCTRAQVVTFLWRAAGTPEPSTNEHPFTDIKEGAFYYKAVLWAVENKVTAGTSATTFSPDSTCTRAQIVTFLWRFEGEPAAETADNPFTDVRAGAYYEKAVLWASETGVTTGTSATTFSPENTCTRAQVVTFLYRDRTKA